MKHIFHPILPSHFCPKVPCTLRMLNTYTESTHNVIYLDLGYFLVKDYFQSGQKILLDILLDISMKSIFQKYLTVQRN